MHRKDVVVSMDKTAIQARLADLREEYAKGERLLADTEREASELRSSLLRIAGAIQVLKELEEETTTNSK